MSRSTGITGRAMAVGVARAWIRHAADRAQVLMSHEARICLAAAERAMQSPALTAADRAQLMSERAAVVAAMPWGRA